MRKFKIALKEITYPGNDNHFELDWAVDVELLNKSSKDPNEFIQLELHNAIDELWGKLNSQLS